jgi:hypothetical protein
MGLTDDSSPLKHVGVGECYVCVLVCATCWCFKINFINVHNMNSVKNPKGSSFVSIRHLVLSAYSPLYTFLKWTFHKTLADNCKRQRANITYPTVYKIP